jgi:hypothetical protein
MWVRACVLQGRRRREWGECAHYGITPVDYPVRVYEREVKGTPLAAAAAAATKQE